MSSYLKPSLQVPFCTPTKLTSYSYKTIPARIGATGAYLPEARVKNSELPGLEQADAVVERLLGARERRVAAPSEACSDMIVAAARGVLESAEVSPLDLDRIIVSATPGDYFEPCTAAVVQHKLRAACPAMDVGMSCVGWLAAMDLALRCIATGDERVLVLAGTIVSKGVAFRDPMHRAIFGDGAGGVLLEAADTCNFLGGLLWTDGQYFDVINMPHNVSIPGPRIPEESSGFFYMADRALITNALDEKLPGLFERVMEEVGITMDDIDVAFVHQPSKPLFKAAVKACGIPLEKIVQDYDRYGNTISAELPISLHENVSNGRIKRGDTIVKITFGAGFSGGIIIYEF